jgi:hypothetical protein
LSVATLDSNLVEQVYARCASVYGWLCGPIVTGDIGDREALTKRKSAKFTSKDRH